MFTGFAWNPVGVALADTPLLGASGLDRHLRPVGDGRPGRRRPVAAVQARRSGARGAVSLSIVLALGCSPPPGSGRTRHRKPIRIVQPNIGQQDKWRPGLRRGRRAPLDRLSVQGEAGTRLIFWPEAAVTEPLADNAPRRGR